MIFGPYQNPNAPHVIEVTNFLLNDTNQDSLKELTMTSIGKQGFLSISLLKQVISIF
jgi:hypothetical protein